MAIKKPTKTLKAKMWKATKSDIFTSLAILSIVLNVFLLSAVYVLTNDGAINQSVITDLSNRYCNSENSQANALKDAVENNETPKQAKQRYEIACKSGEFAPYYSQALHSYQQSQNK